MTYPRVLIISPSVFNQYTGTGVLLTNLFRGWPRENLAIVHGDPIPADDAVCPRAFNVGLDEIHWTVPFSWFQRTRTAERADAAAGGAVRLHAGGTGWRRALKRVLGSELPWTAALSPALTAWVESFKPELIYVLPGGPYIRLALAAAERWRVPLVAHMMDDWPSAPLGGGLGSLVQARLRGDLRRLFERAQAPLAISDEMATAYADRYHRPFQAFQNPVDLEARLPLARRSWTRGDEFRLIYVGSILPNAQLESLADMGRAVQSMADGGDRVRLDIHSAWAAGHAAALSAGGAVGLHDALDEAHVFPALAAADLLVLPVNFDEASQKFIRYSIPAKVPLYLASGTPVLVYGPRAAAVVSYAERDGWGRVVSVRSSGQLRDAIGGLMADEVERRRLAETALSVARARHDAARVREDFQSVLRKTAAVPS